MNNFLQKIAACLAILIYANASLAETLSTDFNTNNAGRHGSFFNVTAKSNDVYISGFDLNLFEDGTVDVYYKVGSYVGSETNAGDWTLHGSTSVESTDLPAPVLLGGITIPANTTYGFYLFSTSDQSYNTSTGSNENFSNQDIAIFANQNSNTLFGSTTSRVFSGSVHYSVRELTTTFANNNTANGNYVNITAKDKDIHISGFDVNYQGSGIVEVFYKKGSYKGSELDITDWLFLGGASVTGSAGNATEVDVGGIVIPAGETYGFAIYTATLSGIRYTDSIFTTIFTFVIALNENYSNNDLSIFSDTAMGGKFVSVFDDRVWNGRVHYTLPDNLETINDNDLSAEGNFFDITARDRNIHISSFDLNYSDTNESVDVWYRTGTYKGNEGSSNGWILLGSANITGSTGILTELPVGGVTIPAEETYGFLIHSDSCTNCMKYTNNSSTGNFGNADLSIFTDSSRTGNSPFSGSLNVPRIWNGVIHYNVKEGVSCYVGRATNGNGFTFCL